MKKTYLMPAMQVDEAQMDQMLLVESLEIFSEKTVSGDDALVKEDDSWDDDDD